VVVPPKPPLPPVPPLPADVSPAASEAASSVEEPVVAPEPVAEAEPAVEAEPVVVAEPAVEAEPIVEQSAVEEPVADPVPAVEPEPEVEAEPVVEPEPVVAAEPEPEPEPVAEELVEAHPEPTVETEPVLDAEPIEAAVVDEPAPAALVADRGDEADAQALDVAPAVSLRGVSKVFGDTRAVDGIDLTVPVGSFYGLVGPNGAGKTTTLSMIAGMLRPDSGTIAVGGIDATRSSSAAKRQMGVLPDRLRTFDRLTGRQLLYYYGVLRGLSPAVVESRASDLARAFDLVGALGRPVSDYSAGMTKKIMLAGAMIHSPRLLVLDEPFEAVDPVSSAVILDILSTYVAHGGTVVLSSHGMELVERVCSRVAVLVAGRVLAEGTVDEVRGGSTLEERFLELAGSRGDLEGLEWLHTFSD
jgi:ABC-2 type transport system ATP-binding protein